jgi:dTDP-glucose 4,6-dehydratase
MSQKLLVTGGAGFIGSNFVHYWLDKYPEDKIITLDKLTYAGNLDNLSLVKGNPNHTFIKTDITDKKAVDEAMQGVDVVVHFAAESHVDRSIAGPEVFVQTNVYGTFVLLEAALKHKVKRFHHISTDEVFGTLELGTDKKFDEKTPFAPNSPYAASKAGSDCLVRSYYKTYGLPVTVTNTSNNYGPYQFPEKFISQTITNLLENKEVPIYGDGQQVRDWLYVKDHCRGIDMVLEKGKVGETYLIGGLTDDVTNLAVALKICSILDKDQNLLKLVKDRPGHDVRYAIDWSKARDELDYKPEHDFDTYLVKTIEWYKQNEDWWRKVKSGEYKDFYSRWYKSGK